jgi:hypothetical protein
MEFKDLPTITKVLIGAGVLLGACVAYYFWGSTL